MIDKESLNKARLCLEQAVTDLKEMQEGTWPLSAEANLHNIRAQMLRAHHLLTVGPLQIRR